MSPHPFKKTGFKDSTFYLFDACALLFVSIIGQFEVLCNVVISGCLLNLNLLCELQDFLLQLGDRLLGALWVWGAILTSRKGTVCPTRNRQGCLAQPAHLQPVDLKRGYLDERKKKKKKKEVILGMVKGEGRNKGRQTGKKSVNCILIDL